MHGIDNEWSSKKTHTHTHELRGGKCSIDAQIRKNELNRKEKSVGAKNVSITKDDAIFNRSNVFLPRLFQRQII